MLVKIILALLFLLNTAGFVTVAADKKKARRKQWRIPERTFFIMALFGACPGIYAGLLLFRHKTRHWYFMLGIPVIFIFQLLAAYYWIG